MQTEVQIRPVEPSDAESLAANIKTANSPDQMRQQIAEFHDKGWTHFVAVAGDEVVGNIAIVPTRYFPPAQDHRAELADIVISPSHQGTGLLQRLVDAAKEHARSNGITQLETSAWLSNGRALRAYAKVGFSEWGRLPGALRRDDGSYDTLVFFRMEIAS